MNLKEFYYLSFSISIKQGISPIDFAKSKNDLYWIHILTTEDLAWSKSKVINARVLHLNVRTVQLIKYHVHF